MLELNCLLPEAFDGTVATDPVDALREALQLLGAVFPLLGRLDPTAGEVIRGHELARSIYRFVLQQDRCRTPVSLN